jgi:hypothetical protein
MISPLYLLVTCRFSTKYLTHVHRHMFPTKLENVPTARCHTFGGVLSQSRSLKVPGRLSLFANTECTFFNLAFGGTHPWVQGFAW